MALPLDFFAGRAGPCAWHSSHREFDILSFIDKWNGCNFTWDVEFGDLPGLPANPQPFTADAYRHRRRRVRQFNAAGWLVKVNIFSRHFQFASDREYYRNLTGPLQGWHKEHIRRTLEALEDLQVVYIICLEPHPMQYDWLREAIAYAKSYTERPVGHADSYRYVLSVPGAEFYDHSSAKDDAHYWFTDHEGPVLGYRSLTDQVNWIRSVPDNRGCLVVTETTINGRKWPLYGWESAPIRWDNSEVRGALAVRARSRQQVVIDRLRLESDALAREAKRLGEQIDSLPAAVSNYMTTLPELPRTIRQLFNMQTVALRDALD